MSRLGRIVCGGGWEKRPSDRSIKFKAVCCLVLFIAAMFGAPMLSDWIGQWSLLLFAALLIASLILFQFERPQIWWPPPDRHMPDVDQPVSGQEAPSGNIPKYDPHNLY
jgi:hypothetical protein